MTTTIDRRRFLALGAASLMPGMASVACAAGDDAPLLRAVSRSLEVKGRPATVFGLVGPDGRPGLSLVHGQPFRARLENRTGVETLIHWHGLTPPVAQDGVPMLSQPVLAPGQSYAYDFPNTRAGTHWMHSHVGLQEQQMLAAPLIVRETAEPVFDEVEHIVMLHDFTFRDPAEILAELQRGGGGHAGHATTDRSTMDHDGAGGMPAAQTVMNDIGFDAYLCNDRTLDDPEVVRVEKGGFIRLRIINAAAASNMWVDLGALQGDLIAVDGHAVHPLRGALFPLAIAQRADIRLQMPRDGGAHAALFRPEGLAARTGLVLAAADAAIPRIAGEGPVAPPVDLSLEAMLKPVGGLPPEPVTRTEMLMLTGGGSDYLWGLNGKASMHDTLFTVRQGERIDVMMHNMTGMAHPMHLHGHYFQVVAIGGRALAGAVRDTVLVPPNQTVTIRFDADNPGSWAFHCHHIYHMNAGMMGAVTYTSTA